MNLNQITIPSLDLEKSVPFYQKLGLRLIVDSMPRYVRFECMEGEAILKDPDGNQLILFHAGDNRKNPPWRIT